uniref:hypothetical protein n=1 Tax=Parerythrobacter lutipelagi TaxID=1964208 RepID=UPI0010F9C663|nr:hypothetical protein [Parerythrobacter lutipelagi]
MLRTAILALALAQSSALAAEDGTPHAPRAVLDGKPVSIAILINGYGTNSNRDDAAMRLARPVNEPFEWFEVSSRLVRAHLANPGHLGYSQLTLDIDAGGAVSGCTLGKDSKLPVDEAAICGDIIRQRFIPALDDNGNRIEGTYRVTIMPRRYPADKDQAHAPLLTGERDPAPVPMLAPRVDQLFSFPPSPFWMRAFYADPAWRIVPQVGLPAGVSEADRAYTAIIVSQKGGNPACRVIERSGIAAQDNGACSFATTVLGPVWADASAQNHRGVPLYISRQGEKLTAYAPDPEHEKSTRMADEVEHRFIVSLTEAGIFPEGREASPLRINLTPDSSGRVRHCRIVTSTGSDSADYATCRIARQLASLIPMEDIFGRISPYAALLWKADPTGE